MIDYRSVIRKRRIELKMTQQMLAKAVGVSQPFIHEIENGLKSPSIEVLFNICEVLGITIFPDLDKKE